MTRVVEDALDALERRLFFDRFDRRYAELRRDEAAAAEIDAERHTEEGALQDRSR
jgi:hypothetical protein